MVYQTLGSQSHVMSIKSNKALRQMCIQVYEHFCNKTELDGKGLIVRVCV